MKRITQAILAFGGGAVTCCAALKKKYSTRLENVSLQRDKMLEFYELLLLWLELKQRSSTLHKVFADRKFKNVAIYGMKELGEALCFELETTGITVKYLIDKNADEIYSDKSVYSPEDDLPETDVIIVTAIHYYEEIQYELSSKVKCPIINLPDLIYEALTYAIIEDEQRHLKL